MHKTHDFLGHHMCSSWARHVCLKVKKYLIAAHSHTLLKAVKQALYLLLLFALKLIDGVVFKGLALAF